MVGLWVRCGPRTPSLRRYVLIDKRVLIDSDGVVGIRPAQVAIVEHAPISFGVRDYGVVEYITSCDGG